MPCDYTKYPPNWFTEIRPRILARANNKCEECGLENHIFGYRDEDGDFVEVDCEIGVDFLMKFDEFKEQGIRLFRIILTIAHLNDDPENWNVQDDELMALCQKCHNTKDAPKQESQSTQQKLF